MLINIKFVSIFILTFGLNVIFNKINFLKDKKNFFKHKNLISKNITPVFSGGLLLIITILIFIPVQFYILKLFLFLVFLIGFFSDLNILKSPNLRFLTQVLTVLTFLIIFEINISSIRIEKVDVLLENYFFNLFFTSLCILIVIKWYKFY